MLTPDSTINQILNNSATATLVHDFDLGRDAAPAREAFPLAEINEVLDDVICPLCQSLHGKIMARNSAAYEEFKRPSHINCRRIMVFIGKDEVDLDGEPMTPDFERPPQELLDKHGHFHIDPDKYAQLRIPSRPEARDFIFARGAAGEPGRLLWRPGLSLEALRATLADMAQIAAGSGLPAAEAASAYAGLTYHAACEASYDDFAREFAAHANDWPEVVGDLGDVQYASIPIHAAGDPDTWVATYMEGRSERVALYHPSLPATTRRQGLPDVLVEYDPNAGRVVSVRRIEGGPSQLTDRPGFTALRGGW